MDTEGVNSARMSGNSANAEVSEDVWVRAWFGPTVIADYRADRELAERYVDDVGGHFHGLRLTIDPLPEYAPPTRPLPAEQLWTLAP
jgi:hypothetical protein